MYLIMNIHIPQLELELAQLLTVRHGFMCFDVTSHVDNDWDRSLVLLKEHRKYFQGTLVEMLREINSISQTKNFSIAMNYTSMSFMFFSEVHIPFLLSH